MCSSCYKRVPGATEAIIEERRKIDLSYHVIGELAPKMLSSLNEYSCTYADSCGLIC
jgi:hypothetical protein